MNQKITRFGFLLLLTALIGAQTACYYDNQEDLYGISVTQCDTVAMQYSVDIKPIIDANCVLCHAPGGQQEDSPLQNYDGLKTYALNGLLTARINDTGSPMPPTGLISACDRQKIEAWVKAGSPNN